MNEELLFKMIDVVKSASEVVWAAAVRESVISGVTSVLIAAMVIAFGLWLLWRSNLNMEAYKTGLEDYIAKYSNRNLADAIRWLSRDDETNLESARWLFGFGVAAVFFGSVIAVSNISAIINPSFTAIRILMSMVR